jgi:single-stranded DNA-binding protein
MSSHILATGTLTKAPESRVSKNGHAFVMATLRVTVGNEAQFWRLFVFSESAQAELMRLGEGDALACQGVPKFELFRPEAGEPRVSLSLTVDHVLALRQPPKERKKKDPAPAPARSEQQPASDRSSLNRHGDDGVDHFGDDIPF